MTAFIINHVLQGETVLIYFTDKHIKELQVQFLEIICTMHEYIWTLFMLVSGQDCSVDIINLFIAIQYTSDAIRFQQHI